MVKTVAIDAGHGINTPGKRTPDDEREWSFNKVVAESIIKELGNYEGVKTIRLDDPTGKTDVALTTRTNKANNAKADILVSCHHNANTGQWGNWTGTETYSYPGSTAGKKLAQAIHPYVVKGYGLNDRGLKTANFHMLRESSMPAILIEGGFMDSTIDIKKMRDNKVLVSVGKKVAEGIAKYLGLKKGSTNKPSDPKPNKPETSPASGRVESKVNGLRFYNKPSWDDKDVVGRVNKGIGFPTIVEKIKVGNGHQYKVKNSKGATYYITAASKYVKVIGSKPTTSKPKPKVLKVGQTVTLKKSASKFATGESIASHAKGKKYKIIQVKSDRVLLDSIMSWVKKSDVK